MPEARAMPRTIQEFPYTPILGWSLSRYDLFSLCKRKYFFHYYAKFDPEIPVRRLNRFKELVTLPLEVGSIVHEVIEVLLNRLRTTAEAIDRPRFLTFADQVIERSLRGKAFEEVVYGEMDAVAVDDLQPKVHACLENLLASDRFRWLVEEAAPASGQWIIDPSGYGETRLDERKVYIKVDVLFPLGNEIHILDWKTGKTDPGKHRKQLVGYATWASIHFGVAPERVRPTLAYLYPEYEEVQQSFTSIDLQSFAVQVRAETNEMYEYCRDIEQNIPLEKADFPPMNDERICAQCAFRAVCFPEEYPAKMQARPLGGSAAGLAEAP
jgi:CRISPR/Cas system-associated exonuclease Cas4 (RecB family)